MGCRGKVEQQNHARDLRAQGWTLSEICEEVGCSKSSASLWCRDVVMDIEVLERRRRARYLAGNEGARQRGPNARQRRKECEIDELRAHGVAEVGELSERDLLIAGAALYAGEGSKRDGCVSFANSDPRMILVFLAWLRHIIDVDERRLRFSLYLEPSPIPPSGGRSTRWAARR